MRILTAWDRNSKRAVVAKVDLRLVATPNPAYDSPWAVENGTVATLCKARGEKSARCGYLLVSPLPGLRMETKCALIPTACAVG